MEEFARFAERLKPKLDLFMGDAMNQFELTRIDAAIRNAFDEADAAGNVLMAADGMRVIGGNSYFNENSVLVRWVTDFYPRSRYARQHGKCAPLGFFGEFDLYIGFQLPLPPTLVARYGNNPNEYQTFNPSLLGVSNISDCGEHFLEALNRAIFTGADLGSTTNVRPQIA